MKRGKDWAKVTCVWLPCWLVKNCHDLLSREGGRGGVGVGDLNREGRLFT